MGVLDRFRRRKEQGSVLRVAATVPPPSGDLVADLNQLASLRNAGELTDAEFQAARSRLLASEPPPSDPPPAA